MMVIACGYTKGLENIIFVPSFGEIIYIVYIYICIQPHIYYESYYVEITWIDIVLEDLHCHFILVSLVFMIKPY